MSAGELYRELGTGAQVDPALSVCQRGQAAEPAGPLPHGRGPSAKGKIRWRPLAAAATTTIVPSRRLPPAADPSEEEEAQQQLPRHSRGRGDGSSSEPAGGNGDSNMGGRGPQNMCIEPLRGMRDLLGAMQERAPAHAQLSALAEVLQARGRNWGAGAITQAMSKIAKLPCWDPHSAGSPVELARGVMQQLADALTPRVEFISDIRDPIMALHSIAKSGFWPSGPLVGALMTRLEANGCAAVVGTAKGQDLSNLFWVVTKAAEQASRGHAYAQQQQQQQQGLAQAELLVVRAMRAGGVLEAAASVLKQHPHQPPPPPAQQQQQQQGPAGGRPQQRLQLSPQDPSTVLLACAKLPYAHDTQLLDALLGVFVYMRDPNPQDLSNVFYALAVLRCEHGHTPLPRHMAALADATTYALTHSPGEFSEQSLSNVLYALGRLASDGRGVVPWGRAACPYLPPASLLQALSDAHAARLGGSRAGAAARFTPQELANSLYGVALLHGAGAAKAASTEEAEALSPVVGELMDECMRRRLRGFKAQEISNAAWAVAKMGHANKRFFAAVCEAVLHGGVMADAVPRGWTNLVWALATVRHFEAAVLDAAADALLGQTAGSGSGRGNGLMTPVLDAWLNTRDCSDLLWACAVFGHCPRPEALPGALLHRLLCYGEADRDLPYVVTSLWALVVLDQAPRHVGLAQRLMRLLQEWVPAAGGLPRAMLQQLWQVHVEGQRLGLPGMQLSGGLLEDARVARLRQLVGAGREGVAHSFLLEGTQALRLLRDRGPPARSGLIVTQVLQQYALTASGAGSSGACATHLPPCAHAPGSEWLVSVDCAVAVRSVGASRELWVAVEFDDPSRFLFDGPTQTWRYDGRSKLRNRWLRHAFEGRLVLVPWREWNGLGGNADAEAAYMHDALLSAVTAAVAAPP